MDLLTDGPAELKIHREYLSSGILGATDYTLYFLKTAYNSLGLFVSSPASTATISPLLADWRIFSLLPFAMGKKNNTHGSSLNSRLIINSRISVTM